ncbi:MAG: UDP-N-acetylmuramoyl-L-alanine--D-glutamate ligase [Candidatus Babeliales bacterium]
MKNKKLGIWGFGAVGTSAVQFLSRYCKHITVLDAHSMTAEQFGLLSESNAKFIHQKNENDLLHFLESHDYIVPSPGIDLRPHAQFAHKWLAEVDIFAHYATTPTVAITGTVGKTTVTTQLDALLNAHSTYSIAVGNIGTPLLALIHWIDPVINEQVDPEIGVVELSSFQLEHNKRYAPDVAILTNLYPNHLDRHGTMEEYLAAKMKLFLYQKETQHALMPLELLPVLHAQGYLPALKAHLNFFSLHEPTTAQISLLPQHCTLFYYHDTQVIKKHGTTIKVIVDLPEALIGTQAINWLICFAGFNLLDKGDIYHTSPCFKELEHRMELIGTVHGVHFINDSKATIAQSTLAAVEQVKGPIILLLGGLSKGVDRTPYIQQLPHNVTHVICFGKEAESLGDMCKTADRAYTSAATLEEAFEKACTIATAGDTVLLSPGGSSYDLFKHYEERGNCFKKLVQNRL